MTDEVTSLDLNISSSSSINTTSTETSTESLTEHVSAGHPVIVRVIIIGVLAVFNVGGNGFTLITIRLTPRLWTKTNFILASMLVADVITGVIAFCYASFLLFVYVFNDKKMIVLRMTERKNWIDVKYNTEDLRLDLVDA